MSKITAGSENSTLIELYYEDHGSGLPVILIHGYPLSSASWERQVPLLLNAGYRVISYDRRGFGKSSQPAVGYNYDTFAADLKAIVDELKLEQFALVGFSMGGGEVARYIGLYGAEKVTHAVFISSVPPYLRQGGDNPDGVPAKVFEDIKEKIAADRPKFLNSFFHDFYNAGVFSGDRISNEAIQMSFNVAAGASALASYKCVDTWGEDFRSDLAKISVPTLIIHGDADKIVPFPASGQRTHSAIAGSQMLIVKGGPHCITWTHPEVVNPALLSFLQSGSIGSTV